MQVTVSEPSVVSRILEVEVDPAQLDAAVDQALKKVARSVQLPGFRKGKAPLKFVERHITRESLVKDAIEMVIPKTLEEALAERKLEPLAEPELEIVQLETGKPLIYKATFEVKPEVTVDDYAGLALEQEKPGISDSDVEDLVNSLRNSAAKLVAVDEPRGLARGDLAIVDFESTADGKPVKNGSARNFLMDIQDDRFIPGFVEHILGMTVGEDREFEIPFPADYPNELAGKQVKFRYHLYEIKVRQLPLLDDGFAKEASRFNTVAELRDDLRKQLEGRVEQLVRQQVERKILERLADKVAVELPNALVGRKMHVLLNDMVRSLKERNLTLEAYLQGRGIDGAALQAELKPQAEALARMDLAVEAVARQEKIAVSDEDLQADVDQYAAQHQQDPKKVRRALEQAGSLETIREQMLTRKVMDYLVGTASVTYTTPPAPEKEPAKAAAQA